MLFKPRFVYNNGGVVTITLTIAQRLWAPSEGGGIAGEDTSAAGVPESYVVRYDHTVDVIIRFTDAERVAVLNFIEWALKNKGTTFTFRFDADDAGTEYTMYLVSPKANDVVQPRRDNGAPWVWELGLTMRNSAGTRIHVPLVIA